MPSKPLCFTKDQTLYFISDLHLSTLDSPQSELLFEFIDAIKDQADALFILGDFFDYWLGGKEDPAQAKWLMALSKLCDSQVACYFIRGNRDFLLTDKILTTYGITALPDGTAIRCGEDTLLLMHGDVLCTDDKSYQRYRKLAHQPWVKAIFAALPTGLKGSIANKIRKHSQSKGQKLSKPIDTNQQAFEAVLKKHKVNTLVHGHTHRLGYHQGEANQRYVLGDWHNYGSTLQWHKGTLTFHWLRLGDRHDS